MILYHLYTLEGLFSHQAEISKGHSHHVHVPQDFGFSSHIGQLDSQLQVGQFTIFQVHTLLHCLHVQGSGSLGLIVISGHVVPVVQTSNFQTLLISQFTSFTNQKHLLHGVLPGSILAKEKFTSVTLLHTWNILSGLHRAVIL